MQLLKSPTITETMSLPIIHWFEHVHKIEENRIPRRVLCLDLETTRPRDRQRNIRKYDVREEGRLVGGEGWH
jgi:hypothetical protein